MPKSKYTNTQIQIHKYTNTFWVKKGSELYLVTVTEVESDQSVYSPPALPFALFHRNSNPYIQFSPRILQISFSIIHIPSQF